jgi:DNA-binding NarL/FixJ family response regulator
MYQRIWIAESMEIAGDRIQMVCRRTEMTLVGRISGAREAVAEYRRRWPDVDLIAVDGTVPAGRCARLVRSIVWDEPEAEVVVMDSHMDLRQIPVLFGGEAARALAEHLPAAAILVVEGDDDDPDALPVVRERLM